MNILYCGDDHTEDGLLISILSLLKTAEEELHIYIMTMTLRTEEKTYAPVSDKAVSFLDRKVREKRPDNFVKKLDAGALFRAQPPAANLGTRFTPYCMLRLYADLIPEIPERILYLDNDVICRAEIGALYHQDMDGWDLAGVLDYYGKWFFRNRLFHMDYINSGVLLLNMKRIRENGLFDACRERCAEKKMFMPDQSALNKLAEKKLLPRRFNEQRKLHKNTALQHFTTSFRFFPWLHTLTVKPWQVDRVHEELKLHEYDDLLGEYQRLMPQLR